MVRYTWTDAQLKEFMLYSVPNGKDIGVGSQSTSWIYGRKSGHSLTDTNHDAPMPYRSNFNTFSLKSGYKSVTIERNGTNDDVILNYTFVERANNNSSLPKSPVHFSHTGINPFVVWINMYVPNEVDSQQLKDWQQEINFNYPNHDVTIAPFPPAKDKIKYPIYLNYLNQRKLFYHPLNLSSKRKTRKTMPL